MIEGLQELEARIFVEQTLDRGMLNAAQARYVTEQLDRHFKGTFAVGLGWQARSQAMYQLASKVAARQRLGRGPERVRHPHRSSSTGGLQDQTAQLDRQAAAMEGRGLGEMDCPCQNRRRSQVQRGSLRFGLTESC